MFARARKRNRESSCNSISLALPLGRHSPPPERPTYPFCHHVQPPCSAVFPTMPSLLLSSPCRKALRGLRKLPATWQVSLRVSTEYYPRHGSRREVRTASFSHGKKRGNLGASDYPFPSSSPAPSAYFKCRGVIIFLFLFSLFFLSVPRRKQRGQMQPSYVSNCFSDFSAGFFRHVKPSRISSTFIV